MKIEILKMDDETYKYNVQIWTEYQPGKFAYAGNGKFCKTLEEVSEYINSLIK